MPVLINPGGRLVAVDDQKKYEELLSMGGFKKATEEQEKAYILEKMETAEKMKQAENPKSDVYMVTVSEGGGDGYSTASSHIVKGLQSKGISIKQYNEGQKIALLFHNPYSLLNIDAPYRIVYTMFESNKIPDDWIPYLEAADKVLVPSRWCANVFKKSGIDTEVVPLGYNDDVFTFVERENKQQERKDFVFLHYNAFNIRKGFLEVFKAFNKAFEKGEPVKLVLKTSLPGPTLPFPITKSEYPNIEIINQKMTELQLAELCQKSDAFVFPSRGEGFGMTPLEAMATGLPTIVPNAHGISEYFNSEYMYEVKVQSECAALYSRYRGKDEQDTINKFGKMVVCDVEDLAKKMRYIYDHQNEARIIGKNAASYVKNWSYKKTTEKLYTIIDSVRSGVIPERKLHNVLTLERV